ncbi:prolipoprotein diacylglyceryl transferase [bacterium]|nr:prolipoprotein diacylglyceryl transferase [bacterium]
MHPDLIKLGPLTLHAYGTLLALSFFLGLLLARSRAAARGVAERDVLDLFQILIISAILGARLFFVVFHLDAYAGRWWHILALWEGGLTLYGGLLACFLSAALFLRRRGVPFLRMADVMAPSLGLGLLFTRIGCFLNGCCFGLPTAGPLGVCFPAGSEAARTALSLAAGHAHAGDCVPIHPAQLYSAFAGLLILAALLLIDRRRPYEGATFAAFLLLYGAKRFAVDQFRYYEEAMTVGGLSVNQWLSIALAGAAVVLHLRARRRRAA